MSTDKTQRAARVVLALAASTMLSSCAVYGPPYDTYAVAPAAVPYASYYPGYGASYYDGYDYAPYAYGGPGYVGAPFALDFGFYDYHYRGRPGYHGGPGFRGSPGYRGGYGWGHGGGWGHAHGWGGGPGWHGGHASGTGRGWGGGRGGNPGGGRGSGPGGGHGHR
jgi:hypothetical protein